MVKCVCAGRQQPCKNCTSGAPCRRHMALIPPDVELCRSADTFINVQGREAPEGEVRKLHVSCSCSAFAIWYTCLLQDQPV